jgi:hypothetical protein
MYQTNLQPITGQSPEKKIKTCLPAVQKKLFHRVPSGVRSWISATLVALILFLISGCDNEGIVGEGLSPDGDKVETTTIDVTNLELISSNGFSGNLRNTGMGIVDDPAYGTIRSSALLKPSISTTDIQFIPSGYTFKLKVQLNSLTYGDESSVSDYTIYEVDELWRGREITYNDPVSVDESKIIGTFQVSDESSVEVDLNQEWVDRYRSFFNDDSADRDSLYRFEFPGIAITPSPQNKKIDFLRHAEAEEDTAGTAITRFLLENEQDSLVATIPLLDQGASMERLNEPDAGDDIVLHNTFEQILRADIETDPDQFEGNEIVNVSLVFTKKPVQTAPTFTRPETDLLRAHFFRTEPVNLASEIFARNPSFGATLADDGERFEINITNYFIDKLFGDIDTTPLYLTNQGNIGLYYSTTLHGPDAPEDLRPRLIITTINPEN